MLTAPGAAPEYHASMIRLLAGVLVFFAMAATAAVNPLPGSTPQTVAAGEHFQSVRVLVTDSMGNPVPGARIRWNIFPNVIGMDDTSGCFPDLGYNCTANADSDGVAELRSMYGVHAGTYSFPVWADMQANGQDYGNTTIVLNVVPRAAVASVSVVSGAGQRAVIGTRYAAPFVARVLDANGKPLASATVVFKVTSYGAPSGTFVDRGPFDNPKQYPATTDANGIAVSGPFMAGWGLGTGTVTAEYYDANAGAYVRTAFDFANTNADGSTFTSFQDLWWGGIAENGWGMAVVQHGEMLFNAIFAYDAQGDPTWYVQPGGAWNEGLGSTFGGMIFSPRSSPYFAYDASRFDIGHPISNWSLSFNGPDTGTLRAAIPFRPYVDKRISRLDYVTEAPAHIEGIGDLWWGGIEQDGWGIAVLEKQGSLFSVWFTYDASGKPVWFTLEDGVWVDATTYRGTIYRVHATPWPYEYDPSKLLVQNVGSFAFRFGDTAHMTFDYSLEGHLGSIAVRRLDF